MRQFGGAALTPDPVPAAHITPTEMRPNGSIFQCLMLVDNKSQKLFIIPL